MATISMYNDILRSRGVKAAAEFAIASRETHLVRAVQKTILGLWVLDGKCVPACPEVTLPGEDTTPIRPAADFRTHYIQKRRPEVKIGKTAKSGGKAAADKRKRDRSEKDKKARAMMKGAGGKKN